MGNLISWFAAENGSSYDSTRVYRSATETGSYSLITTVTPIATTKYFDRTGTSGSWYKIAYYDSVNLYEGPMSTAFYAGANATLYTNPTELRLFMNFDAADFPSDESVLLLLEQAHIQIAADSGGTTAITNTGKLKMLALLLGSTFVYRALASRALSKGYVSVSLEGGNIMKAHDALLRLSDYMFQKYQEQLAKDTVDYTNTTFFQGIVSAETLEDIRNVQNGVNDALDYENLYTPSMGVRRYR